MVNWEHAFSNKKDGRREMSPPSGIFAPPRRETAAPDPFDEAPESIQPQSDSSLQSMPPLADADERRKVSRTQKKAQRKRNTDKYPGRLQRLHNFLDDIWINMLLEAGGQPKTVLVCGATRGEGCTFTSFHLALFLALGHNLKTLYIDFNINSFTGNPYIPSKIEGLASFFIDHKPIADLILPTEYPDFFVLPAGSGVVANKRQNVVICPDDVEELISYSKENFDVAIFNGQPITFRPIMLQVAKIVDAVVMVCRYGYSRREVSRLAIDKLRENNISLLGMILNNREYPVPKWVYKIIK